MATLPLVLQNSWAAMLLQFAYGLDDIQSMVYPDLYQESKRGAHREKQ